MAAWIDHPFIQAFASALLHFLWQGAVVALLALAWWRLLRPPSHVRYLSGVVALAVMLTSPIVTTAWLANRPAASPDARQPERLLPDVTAFRIGASTAPALPVPGADEDARPGGRFLRAPGPVALLPLWFAGVLVLSGRLLGGWLVARRMTRRCVSPVAPEIASLASRVSERLALQRVVRVVESSAVAVPVMIGWLKPVILVPTAVLTSLTPAQIEALLAHELAHVRRNDYLVNLLQSLVETLLFYHPAVWWMSREVRAAREQCCDDVVVTICDRVTYVKALSNLAALGAGPHVALAATDGPLLNRVRRLLGHAHPDRVSVGFLVPAVLVTLASTAFLPIAIASSADPMQVAGGIQGGTPGGVRNGLQGGVPAGVPGGVSEGVPGSVRGGVPQEAARAQQARERQPSTESRAAVEARRTELLTLLQREREAEKEFLLQRGEIEQEQLQVELQSLRTAMEGAVAEQETHLQNLRREFERVRGRVEVGLANQAELERLKDEIAVVELRRQMTRAEHEARWKQAMLDLEAGKQKLQHELKQLEIEHARRRLEIQRSIEDGAEHARLMERQRVDSTTQARLRELEKALEQLSTAGYDVRFALEPALKGTIEADQTQPIAAGDVLRIEIAGEPALPRAYPVGEDGAITLPLLGTLEAGGRTAAQVREEIRRLLIGRKLKNEPFVTVERRRRP